MNPCSGLQLRQSTVRGAGAWVATAFTKGCDGQRAAPTESRVGLREVSMPELRSVIRLCLATAIGLVLWTGFFSAQAQERELKVGYTKNPIQDASLDMMEKWAKDHGVKLTRVPMAYSVFMEKVTTTLTGGTDQFDVIWHNDDWGQLWQKWLETTDDGKGIENADRWPLLAFWDDDKKLTVLALAHTVWTVFYRSGPIQPHGETQSVAE